MSTLSYILQKYNLPSSGGPIEIPGVGRLDLIRWLRELDFTRGAEVGVEKGEYSKLICEQNTQLKLYGIDPYLKYEDYREYEDQAQMDGLFDFCRTRMSEHIRHGNFVQVRKPSMDALSDFDDESLDFVYIDGNHEGEFPYNDIVGWAKKVRPGGIVSGHDYVRVKVLNFTVKDAVERYTKENNIDPWFVLGRYGKRRKEIRDRTRSWMFIK